MDEMNEFCLHGICNQEIENPADLTAEEVSFILSCLVERGLVEWVGVSADGQNVYTSVKESEGPIGNAINRLEK